MLFQFICTVFLLYISVEKSGGECVRKDKNRSYLALKCDNKPEIRLQIKDICSKVEQLQLEEIRLELNRQSELQNDVINKLNEKFSKVTDLESKIDFSRSEQNRQIDLLNELKGEFKQSATKQIRQSELQNDVINKLNQLNEKFSNVTGLETKIDLSRSEQNRQIDSLNDVMGKMNDLNEKLNKITSLESKIDELSEKFNKSISLQLIQFPSSCGDVQAVNRRSGIRQIIVPGYSLEPIYVSCDEETLGGGWTTVMRRQDGSVDFFLFWEDYKKGFGTLTGEFFIGLQKLHFMTKAADQELLITMEDFKGQRRFAMYDRFAIEGEEEAYKLTTLGKYSGDAGDSLRFHKGQKFSTQDQDNDTADQQNCAQTGTGAWWYNACHISNLMGTYNDTTYGKGVIWSSFTGTSASLKRVQMMIRPKKE